jgi:hypothetical protein
MIGYMALGFVIGMFASAVTTFAYCWLKTHSDRVCDAIEAAVWEMEEVSDE